MAMTIWKSRMIGIIMLVLFVIFVRFSLYDFIVETYHAGGIVDKLGRIFCIVSIGLILAPFEPEKNQAFFFIKLAAIIVICLGFSGTFFDWYSPIESLLRTNRPFSRL